MKTMCVADKRTAQESMTVACGGLTSDKIIIYIQHHHCDTPINYYSGILSSPSLYIVFVGNTAGVHSCTCSRVLCHVLLIKPHHIECNTTE